MMVYEKPSGQARALRRASILEGSNRKTHCLSCSSAPSHVIHSFISFFYPRARWATPVRRGEQRGRPSRQLTHPVGIDRRARTPSLGAHTLAHARHSLVIIHRHHTSRLFFNNEPAQGQGHAARGSSGEQPVGIDDRRAPARPVSALTRSLTHATRSSLAPVPWPRWKYWKSSATTASWAGTPSIDVSRWVLNSTDARSDAKTRSSLNCTTLASSLTRASTML